MSLTIKSFGSRQSYELIRDEVVIGGLAYASDMRSPAGNIAFASGSAHIHGIDAEVTAQNSNASRGALEYRVIKDGRTIGELDIDRRGKVKLKLNRIDRGSDKFEIKPRGLTSFWFLVEQDDKPVLELKPTEKYRRDALHYRVNQRSRRLPERVLDELSIYVTFAANVYTTKMKGITTGRWPG